MRRSCTPVHLVYARYICCYAAFPICLPFHVGGRGWSRTNTHGILSTSQKKLAVCIYGTRGGIRTHTWSFIRTLVWTVGVLSYIGWKDGTRTHDLLIPNQALYQTALLPNIAVVEISCHYSTDCTLASILRVTLSRRHPRHTFSLSMITSLLA